MGEEDIAKLQSFLAEVSRESDRGAVIVGAAFLDARLEAALLAFFADDGVGKKLVSVSSAPLATFSARIDACYALALIEADEYRALHTLRKVRNEFAHKLEDATFSNPRIKDLISILSPPLPEPEMRSSARDVCLHSILNLAVRLFYRPEYVAQERRSLKEWFPADYARWRRVDEEQPPEGQPVLAWGRAPGRATPVQRGTEREPK